MLLYMKQSSFIIQILLPRTGSCCIRFTAWLDFICSCQFENRYILSRRAPFLKVDFVRLLKQ